MLNHFNENANQSADLTIKREATKILRDVGVSVNLIGYTYIREAILMSVHDMSTVRHITKVLYPMVAKKFETTPSRVERAIRHAITTAWNPEENEGIQKHFGSAISRGKKPTNAQFIALIADEIQLAIA